MDSNQYLDDNAQPAVAPAPTPTPQDTATPAPAATTSAPAGDAATPASDASPYSFHPGYTPPATTPPEPAIPPSPPEPELTTPPPAPEISNPTTTAPLPDPLQKTDDSQPASSGDNDVTYEDILNKDILELMGAKDLPEEKRQELYQKMLDTIQNRVIARIADQLPDADMDQFKQIADTGDQQKMSDFLKEKDIDLAKLMLQEALIYKTEMVNLAKPLKGNKP